MRRKFSVLMLTLVLGAFAGNLPEYRSLCMQFPDLGGWKVSECDGMKMTNPMFGEVLTASKTYTSGDKSVDVSVLSGMQAMMMWAPYQSGTTIENENELMKVETIDGFPVGIAYDKKARSGGVAVQLAPNAVLVLNYEKMDWKEALKLAKKFDWKKLRSLFE